MYDRKRMDLTGQFFGDWEVVSEAPSRRDKHQIRRYWNCLCICGKRKEVAQANLRNGNSKNCGCYRTELAKERLEAFNEKKRNLLDNQFR